MKLGEIKLESLRLMNVDEENLILSKIEDYKTDGGYRDYLDRMNGAINRALSRFSVYKVLPTKVEEIKPSQCETIKQFLKLNLNKILSDFGSVERIGYIYERLVPSIEYQTISDGVVLVPYCSSYNFKGKAETEIKNAKVGDAYNFDGVCKFYDGNAWIEVDEDETFIVEYTPKLKMFDNGSDENEELEIPETLARIIPYFVKADLFEQDEPELSANARNIFESALTEYVTFGMPKKQRQQYVENTFL